MVDIGAKTFTTIALPDELISEVDGVIKIKKFGYRSRPEFIKVAIRKLLREVKKWLNILHVKNYIHTYVCEYIFFHFVEEK